MTVNNQPSVVGPTVGTASTDTYNYPYRVDADSHIRVRLVTLATGATEDLALDDGDFTLSGSGPPYVNGVDIILDAGNLPATKSIVIWRETPPAQEVNFGATFDFAPQSVEDMADKQMLIFQELNEDVVRSLKFPVEEVPDGDVTMEAPIDGRTIKWSDADNKFVMSDGDPDEAQDDAEAQVALAAAQVTLAAAQVTLAGTEADAAAASAVAADAYADAAAASAVAADASADAAAASAIAAAAAEASNITMNFKSGNYTLVDGDRGQGFTFTNIATLTLPSAAVVENGWMVWARNEHAANNVTIARAGSDTINGTTAVNLASGEACVIVCSSSSNFRTFFIQPDATETLKGKVELATNAETVTGTSTAHVTTPANVKAALDAKITTYDSGDQTITLGGALSLTHSLGAVPKLVMAYTVCRSAELGFSTGHEEILDRDAFNSCGVSIVPTSTTVDIRFTNTNIAVTRKDTGAGAFLTPASWALIIRAYRW